MKKAIAALLAFIIIFSLCGCGKKTSQVVPEGPSEEELLRGYTKLELNKDNFELYFQYKEYISYTKGESSNDISSAQISYGFELREGFLAAQPEGEEKPTLSIGFTADGVVNHGSYSINFDTLDYSGTTDSSERNTVSGSLGFWPQGNRSVLYPYGVYRDTYVIRLENFRVTSVSGYIYLLNYFET